MIPATLRQASLRRTGSGARVTIDCWPTRCAAAVSQRCVNCWTSCLRRAPSPTIPGGSPSGLRLPGQPCADDRHRDPGAHCVHSRTTYAARRDMSATLPALATPTVGSAATRPTEMDHRVHAGHALRRASVTIGRARVNSFPRPARVLRKAAASFDAIAEIRHVLAGTWKKRSQRKPNLD
jgi:hypothetical protein